VKNKKATENKNRPTHTNITDRQQSHNDNQIKQLPRKSRTDCFIFLLAEFASSNFNVLKHETKTICHKFYIHIMHLC